MSAQDKTKIDGATQSATPSTFMARDNYGATRVKVPTNPDNDHVINYGLLVERLTSLGGFIQITAGGQSNYEVEASDPLRYRVKDGVVELRGAIRTLKDLARTNTFLPVAIRPDSRRRFPIVQMTPTGITTVVPGSLDPTGGCAPDTGNDQLVIGTIFYFDNVFYRP